MSSIKAKAGRYLKLVEWSEEDGCFVGSAPPLIGPCCHGDDEVEVYRQLSSIVEEWIETLEKDGRPLPDPTSGKEYSGKFVLRMDAELHKALALRALQREESLNNYCVTILRETAAPLPPRRKASSRSAKV